ncbi:unnamed protein product [Brugia timori]|uniref:Uncharacterized protein n=1 Tax=Brugia timori TaxID=42155 RepID=A0A0R3R1G8_9BILA|nr:unnamed protein product [Brugia timori]
MDDRPVINDNRFQLVLISFYQRLFGSFLVLLGIVFSLNIPLCVIYSSW